MRLAPFVILLGSACSAAYAAPSPPSALPSTPMRFWNAWGGGNCGECQWIAAEGQITDSTPDDFLRFLNPGPTHHDVLSLVVLNSPGGDLGAGLKLGLLFRKYGLKTIVGHTVKSNDPGLSTGEKVAGVCASACAYAFMGGKVRTLEDGSLLGVHQFAAAKTVDLQHAQIIESGTQLTLGTLLEYAIMMGVDPTVVSIASTTAPDGIYWLTPDDIRDYNLDTAHPMRSDWILNPSSDSTGLVAEIDQVQPGTDLHVHAMVACSNPGPPGSLMIATMAKVGRFQEVADSLRQGTGITISFGVDRDVAVKISKISSVDGNILVAGSFPLTDFSSKAENDDKFQIDFDIPHVLWSDIMPNDHSAYTLPMGRLLTLAPLLLKNCS